KQHDQDRAGERGQLLVALGPPRSRARKCNQRSPERPPGLVRSPGIEGGSIATGAIVGRWSKSISRVREFSRSSGSELTERARTRLKASDQDSLARRGSRLQAQPLHPGRGAEYPLTMGLILRGKWPIKDGTADDARATHSEAHCRG